MLFRITAFFLFLMFVPLKLSAQTALEIKTFNQIDKLIGECEQLLQNYPRRDFTPM